MRAFACLVVGVLAWADGVQANPAAELGAAFAAYEAGDLASASTRLAKVTEGSVRNWDYALWLRGQLALLAEDGKAAQVAFTALGKQRGSRFADIAKHRLADALWLLRDKGAATAYQRALKLPRADRDSDRAVVAFRLATLSRGAARNKALLGWLLSHPRHALEAEALRILGRAPQWTPAQRIARARILTTARRWDGAVAELEAIAEPLPRAVKVQRDYWLGTTLFQMRRRYPEASQLLLGVYAEMPDKGDQAAALFFGARALSRAGDDDVAIGWYKKVVALYPRSAYAEEAQYLSGWLEYNRGRYAAALAPLVRTMEMYPRSRWAGEAAWFIAFSYYLLSDWPAANDAMRAIARRDGALTGGKGTYWLARIAQLRSQSHAAAVGYQAVIARWPLSWYALLAEARLRELGQAVAPFAGARTDPGPAVAASEPQVLTNDPVIARIDELLAAGMRIDAAEEMERARVSVMRKFGRAEALAAVLRRFRDADDYHWPWKLAEIIAARALAGPAAGNARIWWEHAFPKAFRPLVEVHGKAFGADPYVMWSIMRKESGFDPAVASYADAQGLMQIIPPTTERIAAALGIPYDMGRLYEPAFNIQIGAYYIGGLHKKFDGQVPLIAGAYNGGPRPMMTWLTGFGVRPMDEFVELVPYQQTREYMKKVTENFAKYMLLYERPYQVPLTVNRVYAEDDLTY